MRFHYRCPIDYGVDRPELETQQCDEVTGTNPPTQTTTQQANTECNSDCRVHFPVSDTPPLYITGSGTPLHGPQDVSVVDSGRETPGPIPNPEAKPARADGTALGRVWESRLPPTQQLQNMIKQPACHTHVADGLLFVCLCPPNPARR